MVPAGLRAAHCRLDALPSMSIPRSLDQTSRLQQHCHSGVNGAISLTLPTRGSGPARPRFIAASISEVCNTGLVDLNGQTGRFSSKIHRHATAPPRIITANAPPGSAASQVVRTALRENTTGRLAIALVEHHACCRLLELREKRTTLLAHQTPLQTVHSRPRECPGSLEHGIHCHCSTGDGISSVIFRSARVNRAG
jgi:hypothetical protein